ncbi:hypothetical protein GCM10027062_02130 [Nocardioides hungaricus]
MMSRTRVAAALAAAVALAAGALAVQQLLPASAATPGPGSSRAVVLKAPKGPGVGEAWIQGYVQDRAKRYLDDVLVQAFVRGQEDGEPAATALTYAPDYRDGNGWFRLYGLEPGSRYVVRFSTPDRDDPFKTLTVRTGRVADRAVVDLGTTTMTLQRKVTADLTAQFRDASVKPSQRARLVVSMTSSDVDPVSGDIWIRVDRDDPWSSPLKAENAGRLVLKLGRYRLGTHQVQVSFGGNDAVKRSKRPVRLKLWVTANGR